MSRHAVNQLRAKFKILIIMSCHTFRSKGAQAHMNDRQWRLDSPFKLINRRQFSPQLNNIIITLIIISAHSLWLFIVAIFRHSMTHKFRGKE